MTLEKNLAVLRQQQPETARRIEESGRAPSAALIQTKQGLPVHRFEGKPLVKEFIANTMLGIEYLWGTAVRLETNEVVPAAPAQARIPIPGITMPVEQDATAKDIKWQRVLYTMKDRKLSKENL